MYSESFNLLVGKKIGFYKKKCFLSSRRSFNFKFNDGTLKKIKTIGDKWSTFQSHNFSSASQPFYVLLSNNEEILNPPIQYTNAENYFNWLKNGLKL